MNKEEILKFLAYLDKRGLAICNFSRGSMSYWPTSAEPEQIADGYLREN